MLPEAAGTLVRVRREGSAPRQAPVTPGDIKYVRRSGPPPSILTLTAEIAYPERDEGLRMDEAPALNFKSLKEQVYEYLREQMRRGALLPGSAIDMEETSRKLGVSKTPLRDALLQLEMEGFVTILPRRKILVNVLTPEDIKASYEIIGALEGAALLAAFDRLGPDEVAFMERMNREMLEAIERDDFDLYYEKNLQFHDVYLGRSGNESLTKIVHTLKKRLYDFPRQQGFVKEWERASVGEHAEIVRLVKHRRKRRAVAYIRDVHWSFRVQEKYIARYYTKAAALVEDQGKRQKL
jgi:DNA-binding GntR family transcriptional regulator